MNTIFEFDILSALQDQEQDLIISQFGVNVRQIKSYLKSVYPEFEYGYAEQYDGININKILRYTNNKRYMLYGDEALYRLKMAMRAKAYIMKELGDLNDFHKYLYECLYLYLRVNSLTFKYSFKSFSDDVLSAYNIIYSMDENDALETKKTLLDLTNRCKSKRVQVKYHFTLDDFKYVNGVYSSWQEAYDAWINNYFGSLLEDYKKRTLDSYKMSIQQDKLAGKYMTPELYVKLVEKKEKDLEQVKIVKLSFAGFKSTICKLFKAANMKNTFILKEIVKEEVKEFTKEVKLNVVSMNNNEETIDYASMMRQACINYAQEHNLVEKQDEQKTENTIDYASMMRQACIKYAQEHNLVEKQDDQKEDQIEVKSEDLPKITFEVPKLHTNIGMTFSFPGIGML